MLKAKQTLNKIGEKTSSQKNGAQERSISNVIDIDLSYP